MNQTPTPVHMKRVYLTTEQAAEIAQLSPGTLENWRYRRHGPPWTKLGGAVRYDEAKLHEWIEAQTRNELPRAS